MKIAAEIAGALAYLHSSTYSPSIAHGDLKSKNVLLDDNHTANVLGLGDRRLIPLGEKIYSKWEGQLGYLDPQHLYPHVLREEGDVYSFGVILVELLTSRRAFSSDKPKPERNLANFVRSMGDGCLDQILDSKIVKEGNIKTVKKVANLASRCLRLRGEERPSMIQVAMELEGLRVMAKHPEMKANFSPSLSKETDHLLGSPSDTYVIDVGGESVEGSIGSSGMADN